MKTVEILTANNISIQYETASVMNRGLALFIDLLVLFFYYLIMAIFLASTAYSINDGTMFIILFYILVAIPFITYSLFMEFFFKGQTVGKMAMGIRTVKLNGENVDLNDCAMRWSFKIVDFWFSSGGIGALFISTTEHSQRIGDLLAQTTVVKNKPTQKYDIKDILKIKSKSEHEPTYLSVTQFTDEDMILIKNAISRVKQFPNDAHKKLVVELATILADRLSLLEVPQKKITFLTTVLQDYIVLTR
ncbi:MAG: RDD family protein [Putridiphycobacter sp.]